MSARKIQLPLTQEEEAAILFILPEELRYFAVAFVGFIGPGAGRFFSRINGHWCAFTGCNGRWCIFASSNGRCCVFTGSNGEVWRLAE